MTALTGCISVGKQPEPTRVRYAFTTPYTSPITRGGIPSPVNTPPTEQLLEVTIGYVPRESHQMYNYTIQLLILK